MEKNGFYLLSALVPGTMLVSWTECSQFSRGVRDVQVQAPHSTWILTVGRAFCRK